jgi:hypothetical protein
MWRVMPTASGLVLANDQTGERVIVTWSQVRALAAARPRKRRRRNHD